MTTTALQTATTPTVARKRCVEIVARSSTPTAMITPPPMETATITIPPSTPEPLKSATTLWTITAMGLWMKAAVTVSRLAIQSAATESLSRTMAKSATTAVPAHSAMQAVGT